LPFDDGSFDAVTNRLSLMAADDPVSTLREFRRVLKEGGQVATAVWSSPAENRRFSAAREVIATVLGPERAVFARAFGKIGSTMEAQAVHLAAGLQDASASVLQGEIVVASAAEQWRRLATDIGHFGRLDDSISEAQRATIVDELAAKLEPHRSGEILRDPACPGSRAGSALEILRSVAGSSEGVTEEWALVLGLSRVLIVPTATRGGE